MYLPRVFPFGDITYDRDREGISSLFPPCFPWHKHLLTCVRLEGRTPAIISKTDLIFFVFINSVAVEQVLYILNSYIC